MIQPSQRTVTVDKNVKTPDSYRDNIVEIVKKMPFGQSYKEMTRFIKDEIAKTDPDENQNTAVIVAQKGKSFFFHTDDCSQFLSLTSENEKIWVFREHRETDTAALSAA